MAGFVAGARYSEGYVRAHHRPRAPRHRAQAGRGDLARPPGRADALPHGGHPYARPPRQDGEGAQERQARLLRPQPLHQLDQRLLRRLHLLLVLARREGRRQGADVGRRGGRQGARDRHQLQPAPHRGRARPAPALARLLAAADAPRQGAAPARPALALHRRRDRLHGAPPPALLRRNLWPAARGRARQRQRRRGRGLQRALPQGGLSQQGRRGALAGDPRDPAPPRRRLERDHALRHDRDARGAGRAPDHAARVAAPVARLQRLHPAGVPPRRQRALAPRLDLGPG